MNFRTEIQLSKAPFEISHCDSLVLLGSCFSENIGMKFQRYRFQTSLNSHGIVFNPESVAVALEDSINKKIYTKDELIEHNGSFMSLSHHGRFNNENADSTLNEINNSIDESHQALKKAKALFITLGSAWAYRHKTSQKFVANCHKIPQSSFKKILIQHDELVERWTSLINKLKSFNQVIQIVFTVSPVRYWRDGAVENTLSKSQLIIATHELCERFENVHYFPSYELVIDDLRDYRFYKEDMLHPNDQAIQYVWEKLIDWCFSNNTKQLLHELEPHLRFIEHRPSNADDENYRELKTKKEALVQKLLSR